MTFEGINAWAVLAAAVSAFALGGLWYGPLFRQVWAREAGVDLHANAAHPARVFGVAFAAALASAVMFAWLLGAQPPLRLAIHHGAMVGLAFVAMSFAINYSFAGRSLKLWLVDAGYHTLQFMLYGLILGLWH